ncbi:uncharacterized protein [Argopecten irradians]|uniref:uncharacterized protein n=1 Tax=Argopecten irradians TaxID=31199 RepID=UPI003721C5BF
MRSPGSSNAASPPGERYPITASSPFLTHIWLTPRVRDDQVIGKIRTAAVTGPLFKELISHAPLSSLPVPPTVEYSKMIPAAVFVLCLSLAAAVPHRFARQADCPDAFQNVPNPCKSNPDQSIYFPHPTDNTKFIQCDLFGRMFIVQCPAGETYVSTSTSCIDLSKPLTAAPATSAPVVVNPAVTSAPATVGSNPCTQENIQAGNIYFSVANDITKFIECDMLGHPTILDCPDGLVWQESRLSCVFQIGTVLPANGNTGAGSAGSGNTGTGSGSTDGGNTMKNPCTVESLSAGQLFFSYAPDSSKFLQCDLWGDVYVNTCPTGLKWNDSAKTCASGFINLVPNSN